MVLDCCPQQALCICSLEVREPLPTTTMHFTVGCSTLDVSRCGKSCTGPPPYRITGSITALEPEAKMDEKMNYSVVHCALCLTGGI